MKLESAKFIEQAHIVIARADLMLTVKLNEDAARAAYLASFRAGLHFRAHGKDVEVA
jgi:hypothetical protein